MLGIIFTTSLMLISTFFLLVIKNPIYGLMPFIIVVLNFALQLILNNLSFIGLAYIIIYLGAICVLFLYVVMLFNLRIIFKNYRMIKNVFLFCLFYFIFIFLAYKNGNMMSKISFTILMENFNDLQFYTYLMYDYYFMWTVLLVMTLYASLIIAVSLAVKKKLTNI